MRKKKLLNLSAIMLGVLMCFSFNKVQARDSVFSDFNLTRDNLKAVAEANVLEVSMTANKVLGISKNRKSGEYYQWNLNTTGEGKTVWKIATYPSTTSNEANYNDLYYCLNASKGFGITNGDMAEGAKDTYNISYDMKDNNDKTNIVNAAEGSLGDNYNKILWILDHSYIPTGSSNYKESNEYKKLMRDAGIEIENKKWDLTEDDIEVVQQMAIWHFTNNTVGENIPSLYINGEQLSGIYYETDEYGQQITGARRQEKANKLYQYFINNASSSYTIQTPTLELSKESANVEESGNYYIAGPFSLTKENVSVSGVEVKLNNTILSSSDDYLIVSSPTSNTNITDYSNLNNFYIKVLKSKITNNQATINVKINGEYNTRTLTFMTNTAETNQPVVLIKNETKDISDNTNISINLTQVSVEKVWDDSNNQDNKRPSSIMVQLKKNGTNKGNSVELNSSNNWKHTWTGLLAGETYTVDEVSIPTGYTKTVTGNATTGYIITNTYTPETVDVEGTKTWNDNNNQDGKRPTSITVNLLKNGTKIDSKVVTSPWNYKFTGLPKYESGREIVYTIDEDLVEGYTKSINGYNITNTYTPGKVSKTVKKVWEDSDNEARIRPSSIEVQLYKTVSGTKTPVEDSVTLDENNNWEHTWADLDEKENGEKIIYSVEETGVPNDYTVTYSSDDYSDTDTITITNTYVPEVNPDLALRKFITKVGTRTYNREPQIGSWTLDNGTTVTKTHSKDPIKVETGDIVTYTIRIYNEGNVDGKATKVTDYLPSGLVLASDEEDTEGINKTYGWKVGTTSNGYTAISTEYLKDITIDAYSGRGEPKFEDLQIVCKVTAEEGDTEKNLKNIAEITTATYSKGTSDIDSEPGNVNASNSYNPTNPTTGRGEQDDDDFELLVLEPRKPELDLALRKFITKINEEEYDREPQVDTSTIDTQGTATYKHTKEPLAVQVGDIVTYTIRVYNEGETDGYVSEITDHLPEWLDFLSDDELNQDYLWEMDTNNNRKITTTITAKNKEDNNNAYGEGFYQDRKTGEDKLILSAYDGGESLDYIDVQIKCRVNEKAIVKQLITNIAEISGMQNAEGTEVTTDRDSSKANVELPTDVDLPDYKGNEENKSDLTDGDYYYKGQEDDDDFEKLIVENFDLALKKFIATAREPVADASKLGESDEEGNIITDAEYELDKTPVKVKKGDIITYTIRVYNEGTLAGFANEIVDYIPEGLEFVKDSSINISNEWKMLDADGNETDDVTKAVKITTNHLSDSNINNVINGITEDAQGNKVLDYKDVQVQFRVIADPATMAELKITNWAEISEDSNNDIDSTPGNEDKDEDDIDYEPVELTYFDLALRKFITNVDGTDYNNRAPEVDTSKMGTIDETTGEKITSATYTHTKDPVVLETGSIVTYTIRVYNEGTEAGYATEITDNIPEGLEFLPENETNSKYKWMMIDEEGQITQDVSKAVKITTNYLSEENGTDNILSAYQESNGNIALDYKDVEVAFKVVAPNTSDRIVVNTAQISKDSGDDIDSVPDNDILTEDDIDREYVKVETFDLSLEKWVTATKVIYNGKTKTTKTGFKPDSTEMAKVDLVASQLKKTVVKFVYSIRVTNEGQVAGYAYEIKDYIPSGLKFVKEDNPDWTLQKDGTVTTDKLKDTLLEPGQSATVEITLTWKNSSTNMGVKTNWAEISADSGDDVDSTPDNFNKLEDDIDDAKVILSIKTGSVQTYIILAFISIAILGGGTFLIKKYVMNK